MHVANYESPFQNPLEKFLPAGTIDVNFQTNLFRYTKAGRGCMSIGGVVGERSMLLYQSSPERSHIVVFVIFCPSFLLPVACIRV